MCCVRERSYSSVQSDGGLFRAKLNALFAAQSCRINEKLGWGEGFRNKRRQHGTLLIPDTTRNARAACDSAEVEQSAYRSYVVGMITVNSLIYNILCIISRDFMCHEFRTAARKLVPLRMKRDKYGHDVANATNVLNDVCAPTHISIYTYT